MPIGIIGMVIAVFGISLPVIAISESDLGSFTGWISMLFRLAFSLVLMVICLKASQGFFGLAADDDRTDQAHNDLFD